MRIAIAGLACLLVLTACGDDPAPEPGPGGETSSSAPVSTSEQASGSPTIDKIKARGRMVVGVADNLAGVSRYDQDAGRHSGFDMKVAELLATGFGLPKDSVRFRSTTAATRLSTVESGDIDLAFGGIKTGAQGQVGLVGPYLPVSQTLLTRAGTGAGGVRSVCVVASSGAAERVTRYGRVREENNGDACAEALRGKSVDAFAGDDVVLRGYQVAEKGGFQVLGVDLGATPGYHVGIPARDRVLRARIVELLTAAMKDGSWAGLYRDSFGSPVPNPPTVK
ncbi:glutamate transport system substrate-binding protein [Crossiella equi]|uniref:Glutamate transport system substrate-binding protein n=1 Tax=Crossiella equi TaxID=130796 RepID=A0ABS5AAS1_9PSEU|nr:transporter substrate-binding domain-containing protein [Crossiella equi]MBP2473689.1 glutamate transport system substrate-binding protein [Crossiella equi]